MNHGLRIAFLSGVILTASVTASATTINYREAISGDLESTFAEIRPAVFAMSSGPILPLGIGTNRVSGSVAMSFTLDHRDFDTFRVSIARGQRLESIALSWQNFMSDELLMGAELLRPRLSQWDDVSNQLVIGSSVDLAQRPFGTQFLSSEYLPLMPGTYAFLHGLSISASHLAPGEQWTVDYTLSFNVSRATVPEPSSLLTLGLGLAGLGLSRRRKAN